MVKRTSGTKSGTSTSSGCGSTEKKSAVEGDKDEETEGKDAPQLKILDEGEENTDSPSGTPDTLILSESTDEFSCTPKDLLIEMPSNL